MDRTPRRPLAGPFAAALLAAVVVTPLSAQGGCTDPLPNGQFVEFLDQPVVYTDGYQTRMDVRVPAVAPGPCGWPTVLVIHSNRGSKEAVATEAANFARNGYVALTFDVRGQGTSMALNNPLVYGRGALNLRERMDVFEILEAAEAQYGPAIDFQRLGVTGPTQGGLFAWCAAAHSGRVPPPNPWRSQPFPVIAAAAVHDFDLDLHEWLLPEGENASEMFVFNVFADQPGLHVEPGYRALVEPYVLAEDYAGLRAVLDPPALNLPTLLRTSDVPMLVTLSYDDMFGAASRTLEEWSSILPNSAKLLNLTTGGHRTPLNDREAKLREDREMQWFDRFLRGVQNGVEQLPEYRFAIEPDSRGESLDKQRIWDEQLGNTHPSVAANYKRLYLGAGGLAETATGGGVGLDVLHSVNPSGYSIADYVADLPSAEEVLQKIPLQGLQYDGAPLPQDLVAVGAAHARLQLQSSDADFLVHVALIDVRPSGLTRYIAGGFRTVRGHAGGQLTLDVPIAAYGYRIRAGHRLRVRVENHAWHRPPMRSETGGFGGMPTFLRALPVFSEYTVRVIRDGVQGSWLELPVVAPDSPRVGCALPRMQRVGPDDLDVAIYTDSAYAGWNYQILAGFSGSQPGFNWLGTQVPVHYDALTAFILGAGSYPPRQELRGQLDGDGAAFPRLGFGAVPLLPAAAQGVTVAAVIFQGPGSAVASRSVTLPID